MGRVRYIGSKARLLTQILDCAGLPNGGRFFDMFAGTGVVSREAATRGWSVRANDHLVGASVLTIGQLLSKHDVPLRRLGGYDAAITRLNEARPFPGFIFREYSPSGLSRSGHERRYFTPENAQRVDGIRRRIEAWHADGKLSHCERALLVADLLEAANQVANIAGTYGCFLRHWTDSSLRPLKLAARDLLPCACRFEVSALDVFSLKAGPKDLVYLDPPYTKRQYASYYHILETIAIGDEPEVGGVVGLRPWQSKASPFCYKKHALAAMLSLLQAVGGKRILISYNSEGQMSVSELAERMRPLGSVQVHELARIGRYRPNQAATANGTHVTEYLIELAVAPRASRPSVPAASSFSYAKWADSVGVYA